MDKQQIIELLNADLRDEHGAIVQYLTHAYGMGEGEMSCDIEAVSRDEMRHLDWLAETIVELGGTPSLERGTMLMGGDLVTDWMKNDVRLEEGAIANYKKHIGLIEYPKIKRLLRRILADEEAHHGNFEHFAEKAQREGTKDVRGNRQDKTTELLGWGIAHEYKVILQYMFHSYMTPNREAKKQLEDQATNEMQHLGWLAEAMVDGGGNPKIKPTEVDRSTNTADMLRADIKSEDEVVKVYDKGDKEVEDPDLKKLFQRMRDNEMYHSAVFNDLLKEEEGK